MSSQWNKYTAIQGKSPSQILEQVQGLAEQAESLLHALADEPVMRIGRPEWRAVLAIRDLGEAIITAYMKGIWPAMGLDEDDLEAISILNRAFGEMGVPCKAPSYSEACKWVDGLLDELCN